MPISLDSPELDAIADRIAAEYAAEKEAPARLEAEIAESKRERAEIVKNRAAATIAVGIGLVAILAGFLGFSNYLGQIVGSIGLVAGAILAIWIYDSYGRESRWRRQEKLAREDMDRWKQKLAEREISN